MKRNTIFRTSDKKGAKGYTPITNKIIQSKELTFDQTALLVFLLSLPVNFNIVQKNIMKECRDRISAGRFRLAWKGLVEKGFIVKFIYYRNNLRREGWNVFESPENREYQNQDSRETSPLESTQVQSTQIESNISENTINNINTGTSILGESIEEGLKVFFKEALNEAKEYLIGATALGDKILDYLLPDKIIELKLELGDQVYSKIEIQLDKYFFAFKKINSGSRGTDSIAA